MPIAKNMRMVCVFGLTDTRSKKHLYGILFMETCQSPLHSAFVTDGLWAFMHRGLYPYNFEVDRAWEMKVTDSESCDSNWTQKINLV
jgi:hypothetical protein